MPPPGAGRVRGGLVGAVAVGVVGDVGGVGDRLQGGAALDGGVDGDGHRAVGGDAAVPGHGVGADVGHGRAGGGRGAHQGELGGEHVGDLMAGVVLLVEVAAVGEDDRVGDRAPLDEAAGHRLGGGEGRRREHHDGDGRRVVGGVRIGRLAHAATSAFDEEVEALFTRLPAMFGAVTVKAEGRRVTHRQAGERPVAGRRVVDALRHREAAGREGRERRERLQDVDAVARVLAVVLDRQRIDDRAAGVDAW